MLTDLEVHLTFAELLASVGKKDTDENRQKLLNNHIRQVAVGISFANEQKMYFGKLMHKAVKYEEKKTWFLSMNLTFTPLALYSDEMYDPKEHKNIIGAEVFKNMDNETRSRIYAELLQNINAKHKMAGVKTGSQHDSSDIWPKTVRDVLDQFMFFSIERVIVGENAELGKYFDKEELIDANGVKVLFTGRPLDRFALAVYAAILWLMKSEGLDDYYCIKQSDLLNLMGFLETEKTAQYLRESFAMLTSNAVMVSYENTLHIEGLIREVIYCGETGDLMIWLNTGLMPLSSDFSPAH